MHCVHPDIHCYTRVREAHFRSSSFALGLRHNTRPYLKWVCLFSAEALPVLCQQPGTLNCVASSNHGEDRIIRCLLQVWYILSEKGQLYFPWLLLLFRCFQYQIVPIERFCILSLVSDGFEQWGTSARAFERIGRLLVYMFLWVPCRLPAACSCHTIFDSDQDILCGIRMSFSECAFIDIYVSSLL